jgi:aspartyl-tRNA(Asn)/glutamyl-tRNA(Gln) amidotransferase subunit B
LFNPDTGETRAMRTKEDAADYRYFPDPDLPPLLIGRDWVERVRSEMAELPRVMAARFVTQYGLPEQFADAITADRSKAIFFENFYQTLWQNLGSQSHFQESSAKGASWAMVELAARLNTFGVLISECPVSAHTLAAVVTRIIQGHINHSAAKTLFDSLWVASGAEISEVNALSIVDALIDAKGLKQINDTGALEAIIDEVLAANPKNVEEFKAGNAKALNGLVGPIMKASKGKANPAQVNELLLKKLS